MYIYIHAYIHIYIYVCRYIYTCKASLNNPEHITKACAIMGSNRLVNDFIYLFSTNSIH